MPIYMRVCAYTYMLVPPSSAPPRSVAVAAVWSQLFTYLVLPKWLCSLFFNSPVFQTCARLAVAYLPRAIARPTCLSSKKRWFLNSTFYGLLVST